MALEFLVKKRHCKRQNGGAPDLSQSDCVRCRHHVGFKGPPFLVFRNRVVLFRKFMYNALQVPSWSIGFQLQVALVCYTTYSTWHLVYWYTWTWTISSTRPLGPVKYLVHNTTCSIQQWHRSSLPAPGVLSIPQWIKPCCAQTQDTLIPGYSM